MSVEEEALRRLLEMNRACIEHWARELGVLDLWRTISNTDNESPNGSG